MIQPLILSPSAESRIFEELRLNPSIEAKRILIQQIISAQAPEPSLLPEITLNPAPQINLFSEEWASTREMLESVAKGTWNSPLSFNELSLLFDYIGKAGSECDFIKSSKTYSSEWFETLNLLIALASLAEKHPEFNKKNTQNLMTLCLADLVIKDFNVSCTFDKEQLTPLHHAVKQDCPLLINSLVKLGAGIEHSIPFFELRSPLLTACRWGNYRSVKELIRLKADVNEIDDLTQETPLSLSHEDRKIVKRLIKNGADIKSQGYKAVEQAALRGNYKGVKTLLKKGAPLLKENFFILSQRIVSLISRGSDLKTFNRIVDYINTFNLLINHYSSTKTYKKIVVKEPLPQDKASILTVKFKELAEIASLTDPDSLPRVQANLNKKIQEIIQLI